MAPACGHGPLTAGPRALLLDHPLVLCAGKGGVGKSTTAATLALRAADAGHRTLLVSTDPAHNLGDIFGHGAPDGAGCMRGVASGLDLLEIDPDVETERYLARVKDNVRRLVRSPMVAEAERQIDLAGRAPGAAESALLERLVAVLLDERPDYDRVVIDTAPTGHTLRLLTLPELMGVWVDGLLRHRGERNRERAAWIGPADVPDDPVYDLLAERRNRLARARALLLDPVETRIVFVLIAQRLAIEETRRAVDELAEFGLAVSALVINRVLPPDLPGDFMRERLEVQADGLGHIDTRFPGLPRFRLPLLPREPGSAATLRTLAERLRSQGA